MLEAILVFQLVFYALFEWNLRCYRPFTERPGALPRVSVLVPCRNEARGVRACLESLLAQDYPDFEVVVYEDGSTDETPAILKDLAASDRRLRVLPGGELPAGWTGKNHACWKLAEAARGEWLLFTDADTEHAPRMLRRAVGTALDRGAALVSTFPRQRFHSAGDELLVPLMFFVLLLFLPMYFVSKRTWKWAGNFSAACGQFLLFRRDAYFEAGGHRDAAGRISEGPLLAERVKDRGHRIVLGDGSAWTSCNMYRGFRAAFEGFSRSVFASMGGSVLAALFFVVFQTWVFLVPYGTLVAGFLGGAAAGKAVSLSLTAILLPLWIRFRIHDRFRMPKRLVPLHGLSLAVYNVVIFNSFIRFKMRKKTAWKGRRYDNPQA